MNIRDYYAYVVTDIFNEKILREKKAISPKYTTYVSTLDFRAYHVHYQQTPTMCWEIDNNQKTVALKHELVFFLCKRLGQWHDLNEGDLYWIKKEKIKITYK